MTSHAVFPLWVLVRDLVDPRNTQGTLGGNRLCRLGTSAEGGSLPVGSPRSVPVRRGVVRRRLEVDQEFQLAGVDFYTSWTTQTLGSK